MISYTIYDCDLVIFFFLTFRFEGKKIIFGIVGTSGNLSECGEYSYSGPLSSWVDLHITT